jgi:hypothetical protein
MERVKGIEPSYSAWKSPNFVMQTVNVLTLCSLAAARDVYRIFRCQNGLHVYPVKRQVAFGRSEARLPAFDAGRAGARPDHAISRTQLGRYICPVATVTGGRVSARSSAGHVLRLRFKAQLIKPTWL